MQSTTVIALDHVTVVLGGSFTALDDLSIELTAGRITGLIGPSGAGKTTLIRAIVGRQKIRQGRLRVLGRPAGTAGLRHEVSYMTQEPAFYPDLTVEQNLRYFADMLGLGHRAGLAAVNQVLRQLHLSDKAGVLVGNLSGGQKQRVSLAIALLGDPQLLVLDEPTVGLDPVLREELWVLFRELIGQGKTILISSHVMDEAERCDDLLLIRDGRVVAHGSPTELRQHTDSRTVEQTFLKLAGGRA